ncbi:MAG: hypothetical protein ACK4F6_06890 [Hylemonella sp.]
MIIEQIYKVDSVEAQPHSPLKRWRIFSVRQANGVRSRHLVGYAPEEGAGRVTTSLVRLDMSRREATTRSGRVYLLEGDPGFDDDGQWLWDNWLRVRSVTHSQDVTRAWARIRLIR